MVRSVTDGTGFNSASGLFGPDPTRRRYFVDCTKVDNYEEDGSKTFPRQESETFVEVFLFLLTPTTFICAGGGGRGHQDFFLQVSYDVILIRKLRPIRSTTIRPSFDR